MAVYLKDLNVLEAFQRNGATVGLANTGGRRGAVRQEIDTFLQDEELANLYFLALEALQAAPRAKNKETGFSYFDLAAIHGSPGYQYCAHGRPTFPTWHRAYLAAFEQALWIHAAKLAKGATHDPDAVMAKFRIPYLDPFKPRMSGPDEAGGQQIYYGLPVVVTLPEIRVRRAKDGEWEPMKNPLYKFQLPITVQGVSVTNRDPSKLVLKYFNNEYSPPTGKPTSTSNSRSNTAQNVWRALLDKGDRGGNVWINISNNAVQNDSWTSGSSIESFHNSVHNILSGTMSDSQLAGYDPVFWLHHCNIDRVLAIWQGIHPNSWWNGGDEALKPFKQQDGSDWTSNKCKDWRTLGYDYPETSEARQKGESKMRDTLIEWAQVELGINSQQPLPPHIESVRAMNYSASLKVNFWPTQRPLKMDDEKNKTPFSLEGFRFLGSNPSPQTPAKPTPKGAIPQARVALVATDTKQHTLSRLTLPAQPLPPLVDRFGAAVLDDNKSIRWEVSYAIEKFAVGRSFRIVFYLGDFDSDVSNWCDVHNVAGTSAIFSNPIEAASSGACQNCQATLESNMLVGDSVTITDALVTYFNSREEVHGLRVTSLEPNGVVPFLKKNLHWRVVTADGVEVQRQDLPSLKVGVYSEIVVLSDNASELPTFENRILHYDVTAGRPNGVGLGDVYE